MYSSLSQSGTNDSGRKLQVKATGIPVFHYSYVRPPSLMQKKAAYFNSFWHDDQWVRDNLADKSEFDYYNVDEVRPFKGTHPKLMKEIVAQQDWGFDITKIRRNFTFREKILHTIEKRTGYRLGEYKNYKII